MRSLASFTEIYLYRPFVDMRRQINGLVAIVEGEMSVKPEKTKLFVFTHQRKRILKLLYWNGSGFALWMTRLEKQTFKWPKVDENTCELTCRELELLLDGLDISKVKPLQQLAYSSFA